jgi:hypothetical protein
MLDVLEAVVAQFVARARKPDERSPSSSPSASWRCTAATPRVQAGAEAAGGAAQTEIPRNSATDSRNPRHGTQPPAVLEMAGAAV